MVMDENWMSLPRASDEFKMSLSAFLDDMFSTDSAGNQICCPCKLRSVEGDFGIVEKMYMII